jgi:ACS family D-galactonate transporter-like MFS transporter
MAGTSPISRLWYRDLTVYPKGLQRYWLLFLVVAGGICLTSLGLVAGNIAPLLLPETKMSTDFYSYITVASAAFGALTAYFSALSDRIGRANLIVYGALLAGLIAFFGVPSAHTKWHFAIWYCCMGFADGIALVGGATLMRDFTPQTGRATAMGINTLGTGASALLLTLFAGRLLDGAHPDWRVMMHLTGGACLGTFVVLLFFLRELPPHLRGEVAYTAEDEAVIEARSTAADDEKVIEATEGASKWKQVLRPKVISANLAIMFYLVIFATAAGYLALYNTEIQGLSLTAANHLGSWFWFSNCVALIGFGVISDYLHVRKPVMFVGAIIVIVAIMFIMTYHHASFAKLCITMCIWSVGMGGGFAPWYAAYSEDAEAINPALVGTFFAVFGVFNRGSSVIGGLSIPHIIGSPLATESGWRIWFICCAVMMALFIPLVAYGMGGFYSPKRAKAELLARSEANQRNRNPVPAVSAAH